MRLPSFDESTKMFAEMSIHFWAIIRFSKLTVADTAESVLQ